MTHLRCKARVVVLLSTLAQATLVAQSFVTPGIPTYETRAQLDSAAKSADRAGRKSEAFLLRARLTNGDFQEGDRIVVALEFSAKTDTLQVRAGRTVQMAGMADLSLVGVLRSELTETMRTHLAKYLKNPNVRVTPLLPISILGNVATPGFYYVTADVVLRDMVTLAGGPRDGDLNKAVIRRGGEVIWNARDVRAAFADGLSVDRLHLRAGDELFVPPRRQLSMGTIISAMSATTALLLVLVGSLR